MRVLAGFPSFHEDWMILDALANETELSILIDRTVTPAVTSAREYRLTRLDAGDLTTSFSNELLTFCPDFLLWFEDLQNARSWRCWNVLRAIAPNSLVSLVLTKPFPRRDFLAKRLLRFCLGFRVIDHVLLGRANAHDLNDFGIESGRIRSFNPNRARGVFDLLQQRFNEEQKSVLWVDPGVTAASPSMRSLVHSIPFLRTHGWNIRVLCYEVQKTEPPLEAAHLPKLPLPSLLQMLQFFVACNSFRFIQSVALRKRPARIIHTTCPYDLQADICSIQFCHRRWNQFGKSLVGLSFRDWVGLQFSGVFALFDQWQLQSRSVKLLLPASRAIGADVRQCYGAHAAQTVLPNAFDENRFNSMTRQAHRAGVRNALGLSASETVFAFSSYGHYNRKGFWLIVDAFQILAKCGQQGIRLLVIGGNPKTLKRLQNKLARRFPEYSRWFLFAGLTSAVEKYLAAADAFLFPSYFEAFCLAEIEAAAVGLPLLVTRHAGTEMIVREGENGVWLEFDPQDIADKIRAFIRGDFSFKLPNSGEALTRAQYAERLLSIYEVFVGKSSTASCSQRTQASHA